MKEVDENWNSIAPHLMDYNYTITPELRDSVSEKIRQHFLGNEKISPTNYKPLTKVNYLSIIFHQTNTSSNLLFT